jgi:hypothetical protein
MTLFKTVVKTIKCKNKEIFTLDFTHQLVDSEGYFNFIYEQGIKNQT